MKALIFSDSHGVSSYMMDAVRKSPDTEYVFFLGDGVRDIEEVRERFPDKIYYSVRGNNDWLASEYSNDLTLELSGKRILLTHGHNHHVKYTEQNLYYKALAENIDIVLFGHTHTPYEQYFSSENGAGVYLFNPGSIGQMSCSSSYFFGRLDINEKGVILSHGSISFGKN